MDNVLKGKLCFKGERGYSAYEIAVQNGFKGDEDAWLEQIGFEGINAKLPTNVKNFGAVGDGVTDDTVAIKAAIETGGLIYFPNGTYLVSETIDLSSYVELKGESKETTIIDFKGSDYLFNVMALYNQKPIIDEMTFKGTDTNNFLKCNRNDSWGVSVELKNFLVYRFNKIISAFGMFNAYFKNGLFASNGTYEFTGVSNVAMNNANRFENVYFRSYDGDSTKYPDYKFDMYEVRNMTFTSCSFEQCKTLFNLDSCVAISLNACGIEQMDKVCKGSGLIIDSSSYLYDITKVNETDYCKYVTRNTFTGKSFVTEQTNPYNLRSDLRLNNIDNLNSHTDITDANNNSIPLYVLKNADWKLYIPINIVENKLNNVSQNIVQLYQMLHGQNNESTLMNIYLTIYCSDGSYKVIEYKYAFLDKTKIFLVSEEVIVNKTWSNAGIDSVTQTLVVDEEQIKATTNITVGKLNLKIKFEKMGDSFI